MEEAPTVRVEVPVAWGDMDAFGHVNNVVFVRWFESGRIAFFEQVQIPYADVTDRQAPILAKTTCEFLHPLTYPDTVTVRTGIGRIGTKSFVMTYEVHSRRHDAIAAKGDGVLVWFDYPSQRSAPLPDALRQRLQTYLE